MDNNPCSYRGTDVSYALICARRAWLSLHEIFIIDDSDYIKKGKYLSSKYRKVGLSQVQIGRNIIDNLEITENSVIVHEFKSGKKMIKADEMQVLHYMLCLSSITNKNIKGILHFLSSKKVVDIVLSDENINELNKVYSFLNVLIKSEIPDPKKNSFCFHGCSFRDFCWG